MAGESQSPIRFEEIKFKDSPKKTGSKSVPTSSNTTTSRMPYTSATVHEGTGTGGGSGSVTETSGGGKRDGDKPEEEQAPVIPTPTNEELGLLAEDRYVDNEGRMAYDVETARKYADRVAERANSYYEQRAQGSSDEVHGFADQVAARAAEIASARVSEEDQTDEGKTISSAAEFQEASRQISREAWKIFKSKAKERKGEKKPSLEDYEAARASYFAATENQEKSLDITAADYMEADTELGDEFDALNQPENLNLDGGPTTADYARAEAELRPLFESEARANAENHAETLKAAKRAGIEYRDADMLSDAESIDHGKMRVENALPVEEMLRRVGISEASIPGIVEQIEKGTLSADFYDKMPETIPIPPENALLAELDRRNALRTVDENDENSEDRWSEEIIRLHGIALQRIEDSGLGQTLNAKIVAEREAGAKRKRAEALKTDWQTTEELLLETLADARDVLGELQRTQNSSTERAELESKLLGLAALLKSRETEVKKARANVASYLGVEPGASQSPSAEVESRISTEIDRAIAGRHYDAVLRSLGEASLTQETLDFFEQAGVSGQVEAAFKRMQGKNLLARLGEAVQTLGPVGGEGNEYDINQLVSDPDLLRNFAKSEAGKEILESLVKNMREYERSAMKLNRVGAGDIGNLDGNQLADLIYQRQASRLDLVSNTHRLAIEVRRGGARRSWAVAGQEIVRQLKTQVAARFVGSDVDGRGMDDEARVSYDTSIGEIVENGSNRRALALQSLRVAGSYLGGAVIPGVIVGRDILRHFGIELDRSLLDENRAMNAEHTVIGLEEGRDSERFRNVEARAERQKQYENIGLIRSKIRARADKEYADWSDTHYQTIRDLDMRPEDNDGAE